MWKKAPRWLLDPLGPLAVRWWYAPVVAPWLARFLRHSTRDEVVRIAGAMRGLLAPIFECYEPLLQRAGGMGLMSRSGCLYVYSGPQAARQWQWGMDLRRSLGVQLRDVAEDELVALEPDLRGRFRFGILAPENASTSDPAAMTRSLFDQCVRDGAQVIRARATGFRQADGVVTAVSLDAGEAVPCDGVVLAGGAWSATLARKLGTPIPLETQRGYHVTVMSNNLALRHTVMAVEHNLMVNHMAMGLRLAGSVEFAGLTAAPDFRRAAVLLDHGRAMFPHLDTTRSSEWMGHRPCLPDSLPVIGRAPRAENAWFAFGHGHVGMCGAASTGREVANLVASRPVAIDLSAFSPSRFAA